MASKHRPNGDPVQVHSAGDYYPVVVAVIDTVTDAGRSRRYEVFHDEEIEVCHTPAEAERAARRMYERLTPPAGCTFLPVA